MTVYQTLDGVYPEHDLYPGLDMYPSGYIMPLGRYIVKSAERQEKRRYRDIVALDYMSLFDVNVIDWYNALPFPLTLRDFRARLCRYIGVTEHVPDYLPNDNLLISKTIDAAELLGRDVLIACEQLNGVLDTSTGMECCSILPCSPTTAWCQRKISCRLQIFIRYSQAW